MPSTYRAIEGIFTLLQLISMVVLSVGSLRMRHWLIALPCQVVPASHGVSRSLQLEMQTLPADTFRQGKSR
jgi:hypothetical protein